MLLKLGIASLKSWYGVGLLPTRSVHFAGLVVDMVEVAVVLLLTGTAIKLANCTEASWNGVLVLKYHC